MNRKSDIAGLRAIILPLVALSLMAVLDACGGSDTESIALDIDPEHTPTMTTREVSTLISDSGITRYHIQAPMWLVFGEASQPSWKFPGGVFLEKFDDNLKQEATVEADSATYFERLKLWRLDGNVRIKNTLNEKFLTPQLFWDQRSQKIYSDSFIHIERSDRVIEGYGFDSNDRLTEYEVRRVSGIFPVSQFTPSSQPEQQAPAQATSSAGDGGEAANPEPTDTVAAAKQDSPRRRALDLRSRQRARSDTTAAS